MKPKRFAKRLIERLTFPIRISLWTTRSMQELAQEIGMGLFIAYNAGNEERLKAYVTLLNRIIKVIYAFTPPPVFYRFYLETITRYSFLDEYFSQFESYNYLKEELSRTGKIPGYENIFEVLWDWLQNIKLIFNPLELMQAITNNIFNAFNTLWETIGTAVDVLSLEPPELLQALEKKIKGTLDTIITKLPPAEAAAMMNPFYMLSFAVIASAIMLKKAYELEDLSTPEEAITLKKIRPFLYFGTTRILSQDGKILAEVIQPLSNPTPIKVKLSDLDVNEAEGTAKIKVWHEGLESDELEIIVDTITPRTWLMPVHDAQRSSYAPQLRKLFLVGLSTSGSWKIQIYDRYLNLTRETAIIGDNWNGAFFDKDNRIWLLSPNNYIMLLDENGNELNITFTENVGTKHAGVTRENTLITAKQTGAREVTVYELDEQGRILNQAKVTRDYDFDVFNVDMDRKGNVYVTTAISSAALGAVKAVLTKIWSGFDKQKTITPEHLPVWAYPGQREKPMGTAHWLISKHIPVAYDGTMFIHWCTYDEELNQIGCIPVGEGGQLDTIYYESQAIYFDRHFWTLISFFSEGSQARLFKISRKGEVKKVSSYIFGEATDLIRKSSNRFIAVTKNLYIYEIDTNMNVLKTINRAEEWGKQKYLLKGYRNCFFAVEDRDKPTDPNPSRILSYRDDMTIQNKVLCDLKPWTIQAILIK